MVIMHFIQVSMILILFLNIKNIKYKKETWMPPLIATQETTTYMFS